MCGIVGVVFGALGAGTCFIPIINNLSFVFGVFGVVFALIGLTGVLRGKRTGKALSVVAIVLSVVAMGVTLSMQAAISDALDGGSTSSTSSTHKAKEADDASKSGAQDMEGDILGGDYHIKLVGVTKGLTDYEGRPAAMLTYEVTNNKDENSNMFDYGVKAFQNGRELDTALFMGDAPEGYDSGSSMTELQPGGTNTVTLGYVLEDDSPVSIEVEGTLDLTDAKVTGTFALM